MIIKLYLNILVCLLMLSSCSKADENRMPYYVSGAGLGNAEVIVNGNPTNKGFSISHFIIQGENTIEIKGNVEEFGYNFRLYKTPSFFSKNIIEIINYKENRSNFIEYKKFIFNEKSWWHWKWQDADEIKSFTENDFDVIKNIIRDVTSLFKNEKFTYKDIIEMPQIIMWTNDSEVLLKTESFHKETISEIKKYENLIFIVANEKNLVASVGKKLIMVRPTDEKRIFYLGRDESSISNPTEGEVVTNYSFGAEVLFFAKFKGNWKLILQTI